MTSGSGNGHPFSWPIAEFARSIGAKHLAMLVGYFDDSGTHSNSKVCLTAGIIADTVIWDRIERPWKAQLRRGGYSWFHAVDCEHGENEFETTDRPRREAFAMGLS